MNRIIVMGWNEDGENVEIVIDLDVESDSLGLTLLGNRFGVLVSNLELAIHQLELGK